MSDPEENIKARIQPKIRAALQTVAREKYPSRFRIDKADFKKLVKIITIERIIPNDSCKPDAPQHEHTVDLSVQADFKIRVYSTFSVNKGAAIGCGLGTAAGAVGGTVGGIAAGVVFALILGGSLLMQYIKYCGILGGVSGGVFSAIAGGCLGAFIGLYAAAVNGAADSFMVALLKFL